MGAVQLLPIDDALIEQVKRRIVDACRPEALYLFGSAARGETQTGSDIDLLVVMEPQEGLQTFEQASRLRELFGGWLVPFDILVMTPERFAQAQRIPGHVARSARQEGVLLFENSESHIKDE